MASTVGKKIKALAHFITQKISIIIIIRWDQDMIIKENKRIGFQGIILDVTKPIMTKDMKTKEIIII